ncbi:hypothetical protein PENSPDRAFT_695355 [Peniophora sp. CONT]|nr:hypothetical protein PENSPDRAFT_695355 [Peniophora sp. CONT]
MSGYLPPPANAPLPPLDPRYRKVITETLSRVPRDFTPRDALNRLDGHLGIWGTDWRSMYEDYSHTGIFAKPSRTAAPPLPAQPPPASALRTQPAAASSGISVSPQQQSGTRLNPVPAVYPAEAAPHRPQTRSQTAAGAILTHRPASAAPVPRLRRQRKSSKPYRRQATPAVSAPSSRAPYTKVITSDVTALAKFRLLSGEGRRDWVRFLAEMAPRLRDRPRFWEKANQSRDRDILKCMAWLTAGQEAATGARTDRGDSPSGQRNPLRPALPDIDTQGATSEVETDRPRTATSDVQRQPDTPDPDRSATPDAASPVRAAADAHSDAQSLMEVDALEDQPDVKHNAQLLVDEDAPNVKTDVKPDPRLLMEFDALDVKPDAQLLMDEDEHDTEPDGCSLSVLQGVEEGAANVEKLED